MAKEHGTPSVYLCQEAADTMAKQHGTPFLYYSQEPVVTAASALTQPDKGRKSQL